MAGYPAEGVDFFITRPGVVGSTLRVTVRGGAGAVFALPIQVDPEIVDPTITHTTWTVRYDDGGDDDPQRQCVITTSDDQISLGNTFRVNDGVVYGGYVKCFDSDPAQDQVWTIRPAAGGYTIGRQQNGVGPEFTWNFVVGDRVGVSIDAAPQAWQFVPVEE
ncbi:uncharacterized protein EDB91DRAFT_1123844 [Suillus paluster]|uniref:uncharacterized protein n=1 Tax=Suillus paluster TaxID=48578 RepID=UPI001B871CA6|nr:uncharacterized protein EDB91DRAFT_1123844 [Suillus paluster]KAG1744685.1 hypothetical protein EDB91DRAFT_1123844 [Suillus paluster]